MEGWKTVKYSNTQETGPANAMDALVEALEELGLAYSVHEFKAKIEVVGDAKQIADSVKAGSKRTKKTVENLDLEVRNDS